MVLVINLEGPEAQQSQLLNLVLDDMQNKIFLILKKIIEKISRIK